MVGQINWEIIWNSFLSKRGGNKGASWYRLKINENGGLEKSKFLGGTYEAPPIQPKAPNEKIIYWDGGLWVVNNN